MFGPTNLSLPISSHSPLPSTISSRCPSHLTLPQNPVLFHIRCIQCGYHSISVLNPSDHHTNCIICGFYHNTGLLQFANTQTLTKITYCWACGELNHPNGGADGDFRDKREIPGYEEFDGSEVEYKCRKCGDKGGYGADVVMWKMVSIRKEEYWVWSVEYVDLEEVKQEWERENRELLRILGKEKVRVCINIG